MVKDRTGRNSLVLQTLIKYGAPKEIAYLSKPHIGTDRLKLVVASIRERILQLGGEILFQHQMTNFNQIDASTVECMVTNLEDGTTHTYKTNHMILAIGHSARDTFQLIYNKKLHIEPKAFAIGLRVQHLQQMISESQYGKLYRKCPPADYKLTHQTSQGRGVYTFCMCPGGTVVNASSQENLLAINGMSNYNRAQRNANSAVIVTVDPTDYEDCDECYPKELQGMAYQQLWERKAFQCGNGNIPIQTFGDYKRNQKTTKLGTIQPITNGKYEMANLQECLPPFITYSIIEGMEGFNHKLKGFSMEDTLMLGVETRTSSPVRIIRNEELQSNLSAIYPCGEGAGYAGGIMSAAMDGIKVAEQILSVISD